ncbi:MAG TPA: hypothetical protein VGR44_12110 [Methylomirabilota bacterium]|jgi:hypothetical protein|nr:hypothetical protein [Methylomirabilota bacterium]
MKIGSALSLDKAKTFGLAGLGAVAAAMAQNASAGKIDQNLSDVLLVVSSAVVTVVGGATLRPVALGFGAVAAGSLLSRNVLSRIL